MTTATTVLRVLVADDHPIVRKGLVEIINLQADMRVVAEAVNGTVGATRSEASSIKFTGMYGNIPALLYSYI